MAYNIDLEHRIDKMIDRLGDISKRKMFGGIGYLLNGNMCFGIHKEYLIVRTSPERAAELLKSANTAPFDITGRPMKGWVFVTAEGIRSDEDLATWVHTGVDSALSLPPK